MFPLNINSSTLRNVSMQQKIHFNWNEGYELNLTQCVAGIVKRRFFQYLSSKTVC